MNDAEPDDLPPERPRAKRAQSDPDSPRQRRFREDDDPDEPYHRRPEGDATGGLIPYKNPKALLGYYLSIFGFFLPLVGSVVAVILGFKGMSYAKKNPHAKGTAHAVVAIVLGILGSLFWGMILLGIVISLVMR